LGLTGSFLAFAPVGLALGLVFKLVLGLLTGGRWGPVRYCPACGLVARGMPVPRGRLSLELLLWMAFLLPGLLYTLWRVSNPHRVCVSCHHAGLLPLDAAQEQAEAQRRRQG